ncbi:hypothetical protein ACEN8K_33145, partial [Variovorax sp. CT11-76]
PLPVNTPGLTVIYFDPRYVTGGLGGGFLGVHARPQEGGRYVGLTPAAVYTEADGRRVLAFAEGL